MIATRALAALFEGTIDGLHETYRIVFVLREVEGLSTAETAECLDLSEDLVRLTLRRAKAQLQAKLFDRFGVVTTETFPFSELRSDRVVTEVLDTIEVSRPSR